MYDTMGNKEWADRHHDFVVSFCFVNIDNYEVKKYNSAIGTATGNDTIDK
jgi:hypothetical protein